MRMHTPGPWHWDSDPLKSDWPLNRVRYRVVALGRTVTQTYYPSADGDQAEADTRLIAAAPELLAALQLMLTESEQSAEARCVHNQSTEVLARDVIARATGEA